MENLLSMTHFIHLQKMSFRTDKRFKQLIIEYANFLQQPLELWMFVPCGKDGQPLKIIPFKEHQQGSNYEFMQHELYRQAKERCLFEGFKFLEGNKKIFHIEHKKDVLGIGFRNGYYKTVENIINDKTKLTPAALIQFT